MLPPPALPARRLRRTLSPLIDEAAEKSGADRYPKSFPARAHAWMLLLHVMAGNASLRQSHAQQRADPSLRRFLGPDVRVSYSQLARSSTSRPAECFERLLASLSRRARGSGRGREAGDVRLLDSTFFPLGAKAGPWSARGGHGPGARLQAVLDPSDRLPIELKLTLLDANDAAALAGWDLSGLEGRTLVFDLGYYSHRNPRRLPENGVSFLTRLKGQRPTTGSLRSGPRRRRTEPRAAGTRSSPTRRSCWAAPTTAGAPCWRA